MGTLRDDNISRLFERHPDDVEPGTGITDRGGCKDFYGSELHVFDDDG